jgi:hypothetical protein
VAQFDLSGVWFDFSGSREMKDKSSGDACRNGKDSAPAPVRKNTKGKDHQASQYRDFEKDRSHPLTAALSCQSGA